MHRTTGTVTGALTAEAVPSWCRRNLCPLGYRHIDVAAIGGDLRGHSCPAWYFRSRHPEVVQRLSAWVDAGGGADLSAAVTLRGLISP